MNKLACRQLNIRGRHPDSESPSHPVILRPQPKDLFPPSLRKIFRFAQDDGWRVQGGRGVASGWTSLSVIGANQYEEEGTGSYAAV
jgi:hypothetical protein